MIYDLSKLGKIKRMSPELMELMLGETIEQEVYRLELPDKQHIIEVSGSVFLNWILVDGLNKVAIEFKDYSKVRFDYNDEDTFIDEKVYILQDILKGVTYKSGCSAKVIHYSDSGIQLNLHTNNDETLYVAFPPSTKLETILSLLDIVIDSTVVINKMIPMIPEQFIEL